MSRDPEKNNEEESSEKPDELAGNLREFYEAAGVPVPDSQARKAPLLFVNLPPDEMAKKVSDYLQGRHLLFRRDDEVGTIDEETGRWKPMTSDRFRTWLPSTAGIVPFSKFDKDNGKPIKGAIKVEDARAILASDDLRVRLPILERINLIRLPVLRKALDDRGLSRLELLPLGYDPETRVFTIHAGYLYDEEQDPNEGFRHLEHLLRFFSWGDGERSRAVQVCAMLSVFCREMYAGRSPMFLWNSNLPGSGKSRLAQLALELVEGRAGKSGYHYTDPQEVRKELDATAQGFGSYLWFDDVRKGTIRNNDLNRWLTARVWEGRVMGTNQKFKVPLQSVTMMTGNQITLDADIQRRTLIVDIFAKQTARERVLPEDALVLDDPFFDDEENLAKVASGLYSLVRWWDENGRPGTSEKPLESFESWSRVVPAIVEASPFGNALLPVTAMDTGDAESREWKELVKCLVLNFCEGQQEAEVTMRDVIRTARLNELFCEVLGRVDDIVRDLDTRRGFEWPEIPDPDDPEGYSIVPETDEQKRPIAAEWTDRSIDAKWGKMFRSAAVAGQWFPVAGKIWEFGTRRSNRGSRFTIREVCEPVADSPQEIDEVSTDKPSEPF
jgi:hypothetical protein